MQIFDMLNLRHISHSKKNLKMIIGVPFEISTHSNRPKYALFILVPTSGIQVSFNLIIWGCSSPKVFKTIILATYIQSGKAV